jgi:glucose-6-phosphate isomerase
MHKNATQKLQSSYGRLSKVHLRELFQDETRFDKYNIELGEFLFDYSKNRVDPEALLDLIELANQSKLSEKIQGMFSGEKINITENRAVLHTALRSFSDTPLMLDGIDIKKDIFAARQKMKAIVEKVYSGEWKGYSSKKITDVVNIGIGGSDLGPRMVVDALKPYHTGVVNVHFVSNVDGYSISQVLKNLNPETSLFIVASKSFGTQETLMNANTARKWLTDSINDSDKDSNVAHHFIAISSQPEKVKKFGIVEENRFDMWDWVGGRYSLWSSIGLPIAFAIGMENFNELLKGAEAMDNHFQDASFDKNIPVLMGLISLWYSNFFGTQSQVILSYDERLRYLPDYLQQADMESNGKSFNLAGQTVDYQTGVVLWGGVGTNGQHAFHQLLHQGTVTVPADFIVFKKPVDGLQEHHDALVANCLAQSQAFLQGKTYEEALQELIDKGVSDEDAKHLASHKVIAGNKPSNIFMIEKLSPYNLGKLIAAYEHKIFTQGIIWDINSFDQWGVELGKELGEPIFNTIQGKGVDSAYDSSTSGLLKKYKN